MGWGGCGVSCAAPQVLRAAAEWGRGWDEDAVTFYVDSGDGAPGTVVYDYGKVSRGAAVGLPWGCRGAELMGFCPQTAAAQLQSAAERCVLRYTHGWGADAGAGQRAAGLPAARRERPWGSGGAVGRP